jgi:hypothetical protein
MRKSTLFISAVLTTFMLAIMVGVVSAYKSTLDSTTVAATQATATEVAVETAVPTAPFLTPEQAAALAAKVIGRTDLFSVETALFENADAYLVTFSSGDIVYISPDGQILSIGQLATTMASAPYYPPANNNKPKRPRPTPTPGGDGGGGGDDDGDDD